MKITVLAGGLSPERDVSLTSGSLIANALIEKGYSVALADVYVGIAPEADKSALFTKKPYPLYKVSETEPDLAALKAACGHGDRLIGPGIMDLCRMSDVVFLALHGAIGENGMLQASLECAGVRHYTGTGFIGATVSMNKEIAKKLMAAAGVPVPAGICISASRADAEETILREVGLPCVIKPASCGSSVGVSRVQDRSQLATALAAAARYEDSLLAEKLVEGRELTCAILDGEALPPVEIIPKAGWYDYANKYQSGATTEICPAPLTETQTEEIKRLSVRAFRALSMEMYGRADFILGKDGQFCCLEVNALPGMTPTSLLPQEAAAVGISYADLCERLVQMALKK